ncbi:metallo-beta-lactamase superfamily protein [Thelonectria olida]|uniref:Metallo-beta-lactamase superfamily protein n=1 Tax=Thelonectria olida TaxID=1576542 RepID=A0A9P8WDG3_9HYPO|nr:metallo-beta-lactamase superfamily protein [Thelonectria olida]
MTKHADIPSGAWATVSAIDSASISNLPLEPYFYCDVPRLKRTTIPVFSFVITNQLGRRVLFDLGLRKDWHHLSPTALAEVEHDHLQIECAKDVRDILELHGYKTDDVEAIILSHHHFDHIGDPSRFPTATDLVVGPGFGPTITPGYPKGPESEILETDYSERKVIEITFKERPINIKGLPAVDYFGDGSFYLLFTPGHTAGHLSGLVRTSTSPDTFILLGGDACHHCGELRPSALRHMPTVPAPEDAEKQFPGLSEATSYLQSHKNDGTDPFFPVQRDEEYAGYCNDPDLAEKTIRELQVFDALDNVFPIFSHDATVKDIILEFPHTLNEWKKNGWGEKCRWKFLEDFKQSCMLYKNPE